MRYTLVKHTTSLNVPTPQASSRKLTHTRRTYTEMRPHAPGQQAGGHLAPAHTERHTGCLRVTIEESLVRRIRDAVVHIFDAAVRG